MKECMNGYAFVKEVIEFSRENAVDILMSKAIDECDWLELKASFYVSDIIRNPALSGISDAA